LLPGWLQHVAVFNPVTYAIDSMRLLLNGPNAIAEPSPWILMGKTLVILTVIAIITMTLAARSL
jgi:ABC-type polysaccharide/polyol phosphate export permease